MSSLNKVMVIGNLGKDPEIRQTPQGKKVATFSVATSESYTDKQGQKQDKTEWHRLVVWGNLAELAERYLSKGSKAYFEGKLHTRSWEDKDGSIKYATEIVVLSMQFLSKAENQGQPAFQSSPQTLQEPFTAPPENDDDLPF